MLNSTRNFSDLSPKIVGLVYRSIAGWRVAYPAYDGHRARRPDKRSAIGGARDHIIEILASYTTFSFLSSIAANWQYPSHLPPLLSAAAVLQIARTPPAPYHLPLFY